MTATLLNVTPEQYHARPGFSSTVAKTLLARSPLHARAEYRDRKATREMDFGSVAHRLVLGRGADFEVLDFGDYKTNAAKAARDAARKAGRVPILAEAFERANVAAEAIRVGLADRGILLDGASEQAIEWDEDSKHGPVLCRAMFDHVWIDRGRILDLKLTGDASQTAIERTSENMLYGVQSAAYSRALVALEPDHAGRVDFLFCFAEADAPHALNICRPDGAFRELGERRWLRAVAAWAEAQATDTWPAYGDHVNTINPPSWALAREGFTSDDF